MQKRLEAARRLAREAGQLILKMAQEGINASTKSDNSIVTQADIAADRYISEALSREFPEDGRLTEESFVYQPSPNGLTWVVDPIDGTKAYAKQIPGYSVMIGLLQDKEPVLGVVYDPLEDWMYYAIRGEGAFGVAVAGGEPLPLRVASELAVEEMKLLTSPSAPETRRKAVQELLGVREGPIVNSVGVKVGLLVRAEGDVYFNGHKLHYWDTVAPLVIAQEAGAQATLLDGSPFTYDLSAPGWEHPQGCLMTCSSRSHDDFLTKLRTL
jgi:3'-phosphoadenosine 5'-phosphosulfate (PAPS) 3'-phosphatase